ncbi:TetR/AcrR family transcriptional regulator [Frankia sp. BMG5.23]|uniref:TetR/AcrR family transcriptional regulator n=1 Tax=Frankia sp. BMG5.23 TaxID=683305 RepID=UPI000461BD5F|nr:TetR/AcrR family transcriptional regulator [Frankia sp. BMG5.23]KDA42338.1 transcriptional regulator, TetR family [Frankia sp. BMG5.23]
MAQARPVGEPPLPRIAPRPVLGLVSPRVTEIITVARGVLETEGAGALTMRRIGDLLGIRAPSLYKHLAGKPQLEAKLIETMLMEIGDLLHDVVDRGGAAEVVPALLAAYRGYAQAHPNLYRLVTAGSLNRRLLSADVEDWAGEPFYRAAGEPYRAQALWAAAHGTMILELDGRYLPGSDLDRTWQALASAFRRTDPAGDHPG